MKKTASLICTCLISLGLLASLLFFMRNYVKNNRGKGPKVIPIAVAQPS